MPIPRIGVGHLRGLGDSMFPMLWNHVATVAAVTSGAGLEDHLDRAVLLLLEHPVGLRGLLERQTVSGE
jgi:hypothetical protein